MAQTEDTELRDLVIEALEKNGSLAKIRALLRANVFLVFEDEGQNLKPNVSLENILRLPEGPLCLSIVHEFLEFCNLKNTLFVYMSESRQGTEYNYEEQKKVAEKLNFRKKENEPILITLLKQLLRTNQKTLCDQNVECNLKQQRSNDNNFKDEQNCTYIVHEDSNSSATSTSQSDNSSDEKSKLHLRLNLDNSDTDTSSDSARDKSRSEYIPSDHLVKTVDREMPDGGNFPPSVVSDTKTQEPSVQHNKTCSSSFFQNLKLFSNNSSSDSTSYMDMKPFNALDKTLLNTTGVPILEVTEKQLNSTGSLNSKMISPQRTNMDSNTSDTLSSTVKNEDSDKTTAKSDDSPEYSNDFTASSVKIKDTEEPLQSPESIIEEVEPKPRNTSYESHQSSQSSQSSVSISDVADLISERSGHSPFHAQQNNDNNSLDVKVVNNPVKKLNSEKSRISDDSGDYSVSPVPSLSNLSLDIHSD